MLKLVLKRLSFLLAVSLLVNGLPAAAEFNPLCQSGKIASSKHNDRDRNNNYDTDGSNGRDGRSGRDGRNAEDTTVFADGSPVSLDLSGKDAEDGEDGEDGSRARCRYGDRNQNDEKRDIHAPDGGKGGDGGRGGSGGSGGSLTVYYNNIADLKSILVRSQGGEGGRGGRGGEGASGCRCGRSSWTVESCKDNKCEKRRYRCYNGSDGRDGSNGRDGNRGSLGNLSLVKGKQQLAADNPKLELKLSELQGKSIRLSKNRWIARNGAVSLLAPGSVITDEYREFDRRLERDFQLIWQEKQPITSFNKDTLKLNLNDSDEIEVDFPEKLWLDVNRDREADLTKLVVKNAIPEQEVTKLAVSDFVGNEKDLTLSIVDLARKSDIINTQFRVRYEIESDGFSGETKYEADIPPELVTQDYNRFILALGKLPIPEAGLRVGTKVRVKIEAIRSLGKRSTKQNINWRGTVGIRN